MNKTITLLAVFSLALVACGDNKSRPDAAQRKDGSGPDATCSNCPPAPVLGTLVLDRMGRPGVNTALNFAFDDDTPPTTQADAAKDAYNADDAKNTWTTSYASEFAKNLGILDVLDGVTCGNNLCEETETNLTCATDCTGTGTAAPGCGNQVAIKNGVTGNLATYGTLASLLADDRLYLDTSKTICALYLAVEFGYVNQSNGMLTNTTCGGRSPSYDVIDFTYSALAMGLYGFTAPPAFVPKLGDGVDAHTDLLPSFPYLGNPH